MMSVFNCHKRQIKQKYGPQPALCGDLGQADPTCLIVADDMRRDAEVAKHWFYCLWENGPNQMAHFLPNRCHTRGVRGGKNADSENTVLRELGLRARRKLP